MYGACNSKIIFGPTPWGPEEGSKGQISFNFNYKSISKIFIPNFLCVFSQIKDIQHFKQDFHSSTWAMPQGRDFWALGVPRGLKKYFFRTWSCGISNWRGWRAELNAIRIFTLGSNWWPWSEVKRSNIIKFHSKIFIRNLVCVLTNKKDGKHIKWNFHSVAWVMPQGWDLGVLGVKNFNVGICNGAPSTAHPSIKLNSLEIQNVHLAPKQRKLLNIFYGNGNVSNIF